MLILLILIILTFGAIFLQMTGIGASYKLYVDLLSALVIPLLAFLVTLMSVSVISFFTSIKHSILGVPITVTKFEEAIRTFKILERNLIISTILVILISAVGILGGNSSLPNMTGNQWLRVVAAGLLDPLYGVTYLLFLQGFKDRLKALQ